MQLVEQHVINKSDPRYALIDEAAFKSKNLYNAALYEMRQAFIHEGRRISYNDLDKLMQPHEAYRALPAKVAQKVLKQLDEAWTSYFEACGEYRVHPEKFRGHPCLPKYKHKTEGRNLLTYTDQAVGKKGLKKGFLVPSLLGIQVKTKLKAVDQVRIVPRTGYYVAEAVYERKEKQADVKQEWYAGLDIGVNELAAIASNKPGFIPKVINGRPIKSTNQYYNKRRAKLQKQLDEQEERRDKAHRRYNTQRLERLTNKRNRRIQHYMHTASKRVIDHLVQEEIGTLVIGKNPEWKQEVELGKRNNQHFVQIPHARFIDLLFYKAQLVGIRVLITEESYTSKASFLDHDPIPDYDPNREEKPKFSGKRIARGMYRASDGRLIHADVNGSYNMIRKVVPDAFVAKGIEDGKGVLASQVVHPVRMVVPLTKPKKASDQ
jgi:putative transposase